MSTPVIFSSTSARNPKLSIKSSFPGIKKAVAWLTLIYSACPKELAEEPFEEEVSTEGAHSLRIKEEVLRNIEELLNDSNVNATFVRASSADNQLTDKQMEPLMAGLELFLFVCELSFVDKTKSNASERSEKDRTNPDAEPKRNRYKKHFEYSSNMRTFASMVHRSGHAGLFVLSSWATGTDIAQTTELDVELEMKKCILHFTADALYRQQVSADISDDVYFNTIGLYSFLLETSTSTYSVRSPIEHKGLLRILKNAISEELLPWLVIHNNDVSFVPGANLEDIAKTIEEEKTALILSNVKHPITASSPEVLAPDIDEDSINDGETHGENIIFYGVPGSGKSHFIDNEVISNNSNVYRVVFHPDYLYSSFVGQILPTVEDGDVSYRFEPGPFTIVLNSALHDPGKQHFLIIEEINRGNAPAIFGDIFQLLDRTSSGASRYEIFNRDIAKYIYGDEERSIGIPGNLSLVGTMNTSDQNVYTLDTAFQRRWDMRLVKNNVLTAPHYRSKILDSSLQWGILLIVLNAAIVEGNSALASNEDKRLGAFFISPEELNSNAERLGGKLLKYLWDDAFRFERERIFREPERRTLEDVLDYFVASNGNERWYQVFNDRMFEELKLTLSDTAPDNEQSDENAET